MNPPFGTDYVVAAAFPQAPSFYDGRLLADAEIATGTSLHREVVRALTATPKVAAGVAKVVTSQEQGGQRRLA